MRWMVLAMFACILFGYSFPVHAQEVKTNFDDHVKAILKQRCASCHGPDSKKGDLDISNYTNLMQGGSSGTVIEPGDPDGSYLFNLVSHEDEPAMPPGGKIPDAELAIIRQWIESGALENKGSKAVMTKKPVAAAMGDNPLVRPETVAVFPRVPMQPVQHTPRNPVAGSMATSPWAPLIAVAGKNQIVLYNTTNLQMIGLLPFPEGNVNCVQFSRSGSVLLAAGGHAGNSGVAVLWDVATGERIATFGNELDEVLAADISPDHAFVALGGPGRVVNVYSTETGELNYSIKKHTDWITSVAFSTDGVLLATGDRNGGLHVWESWTGRAYLTLKGHSKSIQSISWRADSNVVASASTDTTIKLWELNNGGQIKSWAAHAGGANSLTFTRDGRILSTGVDKTTKLWQQDGAQQIAFAAFNELATSVAWCDESLRAFAGDYTGEIRVWKFDDGAQLGTLTGNPPTLETRLANDQAQLAERTAKIEPLTAAAKAATEAAAAVQAQLDAAVVARDAAQTSFDAANAAMATDTEQASQVQTQLTQAQGSLTQLTEANPLLEQSFDSMTQASTKLPADESIKAQIVELQKKITDLATRIVETQTTVSTLQTSFTALSTKVKVAGELVTTTTANLKTTTEQVAAFTAQVQPLNQARDTAMGQMQAANNAVTASQAAVSRWQSEIEFVKKMGQLATQLAESQQIASQKQQALAVANEELKAAQAKSQAAGQSVNEAVQSTQQIQDAIRAARTIPK